MSRLAPLLAAILLAPGCSSRSASSAVESLGPVSDDGSDDGQAPRRRHRGKVDFRFEGLVWTAAGFEPMTVTWTDGRITQVEPLELYTENPLRLTPGLVDAHAHPAGLGNQLAQLDLTDLDSLEATLAAIEAHEADAGEEGWLLGRGWDQNDWSDRPDGTFPTAGELDGVTKRPTLLRRIDGHAAWANSAALEAAGITAKTKDPDGGRILRDAKGNPTGVLVDNAMALVSVPAPSDDEATRRLVAALQRLADVGLTGVHDAGASDATIARYTALDEVGRLPVRVVVYAVPDSEAAARLKAEGPWHGDRLSVVGVKLSADGALGSRGAWLGEPYHDEPAHSGLSMLSDELLVTTATELLAADAQLAVHAIGDAAVHQVLDAYQAARFAQPDKTAVPLRLEHAQIVRPGDVPRFAELGVIASMQPTHCTSDMPWAPERLGPERTDWAYRWVDLQEAGATLAFGSDLPVEKPDPALGLWSATRRQDLSGEPPEGWAPDQAVSMAEAIRLFSEGSAAAAGQEWSGISLGAPADLAVWEVRDDAPWRPVASWVAGERTDRDGS